MNAKPDVIGYFLGIKWFASGPVAEFDHSSFRLGQTICFSDFVLIRMIERNPRNSQEERKGLSALREAEELF